MQQSGLLAHPEIQGSFRKVVPSRSNFSRRFLKSDSISYTLDLHRNPEQSDLSSPLISFLGTSVDHVSLSTSFTHVLPVDLLALLSQLSTLR